MDAQDPQVAWLVRDMRTYLRKRPKRNPLSDAAEYAYRLYETNTAALPSAEIACKGGCGSCCCSQVGVDMPEAFAIVKHLRETLDAAAFEALTERVETCAEKVGGVDAGTRWTMQVPCVFLDADTQMCTIYPVRPIACRGYTSTDYAACETSTRTLNHDHPIPADGERMIRARQLRIALGEVTERLIGKALDEDNVELHVAVRRAANCASELAWLKTQKRG